MPSKIGNLIEESSVSIGTGNLTLVTTTGKRSFNTEFGTGGTDKFYYFIFNINVSEWEIGTGHLLDSTTLVRDTVLSSSNANSLVSFSVGTKIIANDLPAALQTQLETLSSDLAGKQPIDSQLTSLAGLAFGGNTLKVIRVNAGETDFELATISGGGATDIDGLTDAITDYITTFNIGIGSGALTSFTTGNNNTSTGINALLSNTTGSFNTAFGVDALKSSIIRSNNTAFGYQALRLMTGDSDSTAIGYKALSVSTAAHNTAIGARALQSNTTGSGNVAIGIDSIPIGTTTSGNIAIGDNTLVSQVGGNGNIAIGGAALASNTVSNNIGIGVQSLINSTSATNNTAVGNGNVLNGVITGSRNTAVGFQTNKVGDSIDNTAIGYSALGHATLGSGSQNTAVGSLSMDAGIIGNNNTAVGYDSLGVLAGNISNNTSIGALSLPNLTSGGSGGNTAVGKSSGTGLTTGSSNTFLGLNSGTSLGTISNCIAIGNGASVSVSNTAQIGNASVTDVYFGTGLALLRGDGSVLTNLPSQVSDSITDGVLTLAPSQNAVFDALALKQALDTQLTSISALSYTSNTLKAIRVNTGETDFELFDHTIITQNSQSVDYTLVLSDAGKHILHPSADTTARTFTIPANSSIAYSIGAAVTFVNQNGAGVITIAITTDTMRLAGAGTTGSRTLAANGVATALKITSTEWIISGTGLT